MKLIILDFLRRWWWLWAISVIGNSLLVWAISATGNKFCMIYPVGMFMGAMLLSFDLQRGITRSIVSLPVTARQVANAWWLVSIGLPTLAIILNTFLMYVGFACWRHDWSGLPGCVISCVSNFVTLATMFYALTGLPRPGASYSDWQARVRGYFFGALWGFSFAGSIFFQNMHLTLLNVLGLFLAGVCLAIMGWFSAVKLVSDRARTLSGSTAPRAKNTAPSRAAEGFGGLAFLAQNIFSRMIYMGTAMFAVFAIILPVIHTVTHSAPIDYMSDTFPIFSFQFLWVMTFQIAAFTMNVRYLRTLPVSTTKLAGVLVFTTLATLLLIFYGAMLLLSAVFHAPLPLPEKIIQQGTLLQIAIAATAVPLFLWRPMEILTFIIMVLLMGGGMFAIFFKQGLPPVVSASASVIIIVGVFVATKMLLERNSRAYRPRTNQFGPWNMGGGR